MDIALKVIKYLNNVPYIFSHLQQWVPLFIFAFYNLLFPLANDPDGSEWPLTLVGKISDHEALACMQEHVETLPVHSHRWLPFDPNMDCLNSQLIRGSLEITCRSLMS